VVNSDPRVLQRIEDLLVLGWFTGRTPVRYGGRSGRVVAVLSVDAQLVPRKEPGLIEGQTPCRALISRALTLVVSRGS
jgi:hypothetical protein